MASIAGGFRDTLIDSRLCTLEGLVAPSRAISVVTSAMDGIWLEADHQVHAHPLAHSLTHSHVDQQCILWCNQLVHVITNALLQLVEPKAPHALVAAARERHRILQQHFVSNASSVLLQQHDAPRARPAFEELDAGAQVARELTTKLPDLSHRGSLIVHYDLDQVTTMALDAAPHHKNGSTLVVVSDAEIGRALLVYGCRRHASERTLTECHRLSHEMITAVPHNDDLVPNAQQSRDTRIPRHPRSYRSVAASHVAVAHVMTAFDTIVLDLVEPHGRRFVAAQLLVDAAAAPSSETTLAEFVHDGSQLVPSLPVFGTSQLSLDAGLLFHVIHLPPSDRHWPLSISLTCSPTQTAASREADRATSFAPLVFWSRAFTQSHADHREQAYRVNATSFSMRFHHQSEHGTALVVISDPSEQQSLVLRASLDLSGALEQYGRSFGAMLTVMPALVTAWLLVEQQLMWLLLGSLQVRSSVGHLVACSPFVLVVGSLVVPALYLVTRQLLGALDHGGELPAWLGNLGLIAGVPREWPSSALEVGVLFLVAYPVVFAFTTLAQGVPKLLSLVMSLIGCSAESIPARYARERDRSLPSEPLRCTRLHTLALILCSGYFSIWLALIGVLVVQHSFVMVALSAVCCCVCCALHLAQYERHDNRVQLYTMVLVLHLHALAVMVPSFIVWLHDTPAYGWHHHGTDDSFRHLAAVLSLLAMGVQMMRAPRRYKCRPARLYTGTEAFVIYTVPVPVVCAAAVLVASHGVAVVPPLHHLPYLLMLLAIIELVLAVFIVPYYE